ncbi:MAG: YfiR family protein [bacterium]|nr:YfiR family protein [bacterium]
MKTLKVIFVLIFVLFTLTATLSAANETADSLLAKILLKLISFDKQIARFGDTITIGVSEDGMLLALRKMSDTKILGKKFSAIKLLLPEEVEKCNVIYIGSSMRKRLPEISKITRAKKVLSFSPHNSYLKKGLAMALEIEDSLPIIWMNLANATREGSDISLKSLKLVIIKGMMKE